MLFYWLGLGAFVLEWCCVWDCMFLFCVLVCSVVLLAWVCFLWGEWACGVFSLEQ